MILWLYSDVAGAEERLVPGLSALFLKVAWLEWPMHGMLRPSGTTELPAVQEE